MILKHKKTWSVVVALSLTGCGGETNEFSNPEAPVTPPDIQGERMLANRQAISLTQVPVSVHRRAAQLLEELRGSTSAPTWVSAILAEDVQPLYRPDVLGVAYYELRVLAGTREAGFIIVSTGEHDYPIAHWSSSGSAPTRQLLSQPGAGAATRFYKLDTLSYAAEDAQGAVVASLNELPPRIVGQDPSVLDKPIEGTDITWVQEKPSAKDEEISTSRLIRRTQGPTTPEPIKLTGWGSWTELKERYGEYYGVLAGSLKREAAEDWKTEALVNEWGEGLLIDRPYDVALLFPRGVEFTVDGEGREAGRAELVATVGGQKLVIAALKDKPGGALPLSVDVRYANGLQETLRFAIVSRGDVIPAEINPLSSSEEHWADQRLMGPWSPWVETWAGNETHQRRDKQILPQSSPNTSNCKSGCGPTTWAMLFGRGDVLASEGHPTWAHRPGLYRTNGCVSGSMSAVAPQDMDAGVRNMTWELSARVATFCNFANDDGATFASTRAD